jgi:hypothetical protein
MRANLLVALLMVFIVITPLTRVASADSHIAIVSDDEIRIEPIAFWNISESLEPRDICVSKNGTIFTVSITSGWELMRGQGITSFEAYSHDGDMIWSKRYGTWGRKLFGVTTDNTYVYVTGFMGPYLLVGKYDFRGNEIWNATYDLGEADCGLRISVLSKGYIAVRASSPYFYQQNSDHHLAVLNSSGVLQWQRTLMNYSFVAADSDYLYIISNNTLEKLYLNGTSIWSFEFREESRIFASDGILYSITQPVYYNRTFLTIQGISTTSGKREWTTFARITDRENRLYNWTDIDYCIAKNKSLTILLSVPDCDGWHILSITQQGEIEWHNVLLDTSWRHVKSEIDDLGRLYAVGDKKGTGESFAIFGIMYPEPIQMDFILISVALVCVVIFDAFFIFHLRKKYAR